MLLLGGDESPMSKSSYDHEYDYTRAQCSVLLVFSMVTCNKPSSLYQFLPS